MVVQPHVITMKDRVLIGMLNELYSRATFLNYHYVLLTQFNLKVPFLDFALKKTTHFRAIFIFRVSGHFLEVFKLHQF